MLTPCLDVTLPRLHAFPGSATGFALRIFPYHQLVCGGWVFVPTPDHLPGGGLVTFGSAVPPDGGTGQNILATRTRAYLPTRHLHTAHTLTISPPSPPTAATYRPVRLLPTPLPCIPCTLPTPPLTTHASAHAAKRSTFAFAPAVTTTPAYLYFYHAMPYLLYIRLCLPLFVLQQPPSLLFPRYAFPIPLLPAYLYRW